MEASKCVINAKVVSTLEKIVNVHKEKVVELTSSVVKNVVLLRMELVNAKLVHLELIKMLEIDVKKLFVIHRLE
jgi:hypothetical protein